MLGIAARGVRLTRGAVLVAAVAVAAACGTPHAAARSAANPTPVPTVPTASRAAIPGSLLSQARPIGTGPRFTLPATGPIAGRCQPGLGPRFGVHVEVFAANRVLLLPAGIGVRQPERKLDGRVISARCYGALVTLDPTGLVLVRPGQRLTLRDLFRSWGEPLSRTRLTSFTAATDTQVTVFVDGRPWPGDPTTVPLTRHDEIVLEIGPRVPPHSSYAFPAGT